MPLSVLSTLPRSTLGKDEHLQIWLKTTTTSFLVLIWFVCSCKKKKMGNTKFLLPRTGTKILGLIHSIIYFLNISRFYYYFFFKEKPYKCLMQYVIFISIKTSQMSHFIHIIGCGYSDFDSYSGLLLVRETKGRSPFCYPIFDSSHECIHWRICWMHLWSAGFLFIYPFPVYFCVEQIKRD